VAAKTRVALADRERGIAFDGLIAATNRWPR